MIGRLLARIAESDRLRDGQEAEGMGLRAARVFAVPFQFSKDPARQARFEMGFRDGRALMEVDDAAADAETGTETAEGGLRMDGPGDSALRTEASGESTDPPA